MNYRVIFTPKAGAQLSSLFRYIALEASPETATRYTEAIISYCESLSTYPHRGTNRQDIRPGLRITNFKKRVVIAFGMRSSVFKTTDLGQPNRNKRSFVSTG